MSVPDSTSPVLTHLWETVCYRTIKMLWDVLSVCMCVCLCLCVCDGETERESLRVYLYDIFSINVSWQPLILAYDSSIFVVSAVTVPPAARLAHRHTCLTAGALHIVQPDLTCTQTRPQIQQVSTSVCVCITCRVNYICCVRVIFVFVHHTVWCMLCVYVCV